MASIPKVTSAVQTDETNVGEKSLPRAEKVAGIVKKLAGALHRKEEEVKDAAVTTDELMRLIHPKWQEHKSELLNKLLLYDDPLEIAELKEISSHTGNVKVFKEVIDPLFNVIYLKRKTEDDLKTALFYHAVFDVVPDEKLLLECEFRLSSAKKKEVVHELKMYQRIHATTFQKWIQYSKQGIGTIWSATRWFTGSGVSLAVGTTKGASFFVGAAVALKMYEHLFASFLETASIQLFPLSNYFAYSLNQRSLNNFGSFISTLASVTLEQSKVTLTDFSPLMVYRNVCFNYAGQSTEVYKACLQSQFQNILLGLGVVALSAGVLYTIDQHSLSQTIAGKIITRFS